MRAEDKERPAILVLLPTLEAMPCAYQRQLSCVFPSIHVEASLISPSASPPPLQLWFTAVASRGPGRPFDQCRRAAARSFDQPERYHSNSPSGSSGP